MTLLSFCDIPWWLTWLLPALLGIALGYALWAKYKSIADDLTGRFNVLNGKYDAQAAQLKTQTEELNYQASELSNNKHRISELVGDVALAHGLTKEAQDETNLWKAKASATADLSSGATSSHVDELAKMKLQLANAEKDAAKAKADATASINAANVAHNETVAKLNAQIIAVEGDLQKSKSDAASASASLSSSQNDELVFLKSKLAAAESKVSSLESDLATCKAAVSSATAGSVSSMTSGSNEGIVSKPKTSPFSSIENTNLEIIEGIGPKMAEVLNENGIHTWSDLSGKSFADLRATLDKYGDKYKIIDPSTWINEAKLAAAGDWRGVIDAQKADGSESKLEKYMVTKGYLKTWAKDDLKVIEGIGPKIAELLINAGINTWKQLADAPVDKIQSILDAAGPSYQMAKPGSWPQQAALAAAGKFDELQSLQDELIAGV